MPDVDIAYETRTALTHEQAVERCREALAAEGFGVLTEIDIAGTLRKKVGAEMEPYVILGACHPPSAHRAVTAVPEIGVFLPCNVTISVEGGRTVVRAMNPEAAMGMVDDAAVAEVADEVGAALKRVLSALG
jgi:uncharacterized protein (DUF302 family)